MQSLGLPSGVPEFMQSSKGYLDSHDGEHMMGTTIMAVSFKGGVVMGADSRTYISLNLVFSVYAGLHSQY